VEFSRGQPVVQKFYWPEAWQRPSNFFFLSRPLEYKAEITTGPDIVDTDSQNEELVLEATNNLLPEQDL
jgi:hypothetical protein